MIAIAVLAAVLRLGEISSSNSLHESLLEARSAYATVYVYRAGTLELAEVYSDILGTRQANPFIASSKGRWRVYVADGDYDVVLSSSRSRVKESAIPMLGGMPLRDFLRLFVGCR